MHPTMTDEELESIVFALQEIQKNHELWAQDYIYNNHTNEFRHKDEPEDKTVWVTPWFEI